MGTEKKKIGFNEFLQGRLRHCLFVLGTGVTLLGGGLTGLRFERTMTEGEFLVVSFMLISGAYLIAMAILLFVLVLLLSLFNRNNANKRKETKTP